MNGVERPKEVLLKEDSRDLLSFKRTHVSSLEGAQLLDVETQGARDAKLHELALLVPAFIEHVAFDVVHDQPIELRMMDAWNRDACVSTHKLHVCTFCCGTLFGNKGIRDVIDRDRGPALIIPGTTMKLSGPRHSVRAL